VLHIAASSHPAGLLPFEFLVVKAILTFHASGFLRIYAYAEEVFMSDLRPVVEQEQVLALLQQHFSEPVSDLVPVEGGQVARTFAFRVGEQEYILRFNDAGRIPISFAKEAMLSQRMASLPIPFPPVLQVGSWHGLHFAISRRLPGRMLIELPLPEVEQLLPELIALLDIISHIDVSQTKNYGIFDDQGVGLFPDWRSSLVRVREEEEDWDYYGKWHHMFDDTFLERKLFDDLFQHMLDLLDRCPSERYFVHGGYSFRNILAYQGRISGVVDWIGAQYGDFVYDIAGLDFWVPELNMRERCLHYYQARHVTLPFYEERVLCYECHTTLDAMRFFAKKGDYQAYQWSCQRMQQLLQRSV
jgi:hygromycin-B 4-O-kinase